MLGHAGEGRLLGQVRGLHVCMLAASLAEQPQRLLIQSKLVLLVSKWTSLFLMMSNLGPDPGWSACDDDVIGILCIPPTWPE